jgi:hypothetical protein
MAPGIGAEGLITLGRQAIGDGVITTDIGTTVTTGFITDGTKARNVRLFIRTHNETLSVIAMCVCDPDGVRVVPNKFCRE